MELVKLNKQAVLIPTPGQTEQEYLCRRLADKGRFVSYPQSEFNLAKALGDVKKLILPEHGLHNENLLADALQSVIAHK
jgi:hypothetical protein